VRYLRRKGDEEREAERYTEATNPPDPKAVWWHHTRAETLFDLAAWLDGSMDLGWKPEITRETVRQMLAGKTLREPG